MLLGCIGDDFTGSSDLANTLSKEGMRVAQYCGTPDNSADADVEAGVISLKSRTIPAEDAVTLSLEALDWLLTQGCQQIFFKYCSTFDSRPEGNIGPVADALGDRLGEKQVIVCPAFPATGRSVYQGHLFVNDSLLHESGMENHPLTPMSDANLRRWLAPQTKRTVNWIPYHIVTRGAEAIEQHIQSIDGASLIIVDAITDIDLRQIGLAISDRKLVSGGSGLAMSIPGNFKNQNLLRLNNTSEWLGEKGPGVILSGSCSNTTRSQIDYYKKTHPSLEIRTEQLISGDIDAVGAVAWLLEKNNKQPLVYTSANSEVTTEQAKKYGMDSVSQMIEQFFAEVAYRLVEAGICRLVTAGGETSGAVIEGLKLSAFEIGPEIDPGIPAVRALGDHRLVLSMKSGNFGSVDFFEKSLRVLNGP